VNNLLLMFLLSLAQ